MRITDYLTEGEPIHKLTQQELEQWLWKAADILRGPVKPERYPSYILPLLFYKRLSDVYLEEFQEAFKKYKSEEAAKLKHVHRFEIPDGCLWDDNKDGFSSSLNPLQPLPIDPAYRTVRIN